MERLTAKQAQSMMEAVASVYEKKGDCVDKKEKGDHNCAKKVCHEEYGQGECIFGQHAVPDENGFVSHYDVQFEHGIVENVSVEDLEILEAYSHPKEGHRYEGEDLQEVDLKKLYDGVVKNQPRGGSASGNAPSPPTTSGPTTSGTKPSERMRDSAPARSRVMQNSSAPPANSRTDTDNVMQKSSSAPSVKNVDSTSPPKTDKPLATLNRAKRGDGFLGPTVSAGGYRMGIPNPVRKEEVEQVSEAGGPALPGEPGRPGTPKAPGGRPHLPGEKPTPKPKGNPGLRLAGVDLFDIVKGHFIDEGLTEEEALKKMITLTDEQRTEIIEGSCGSKSKKKKKGGYGK